MPRRRSRIPIQGTGRPYHASPRDLRDLRRQGKVVRGAEGWRFTTRYLLALKAALGEKRYKARKLPWNAGEPAGGGMFLVWPRLEPDPEQSRWDHEILKARPDANGTDEAADTAVYHV